MSTMGRRDWIWHGLCSTDPDFSAPAAETRTGDLCDLQVVARATRSWCAMRRSAARCVGVRKGGSPDRRSRWADTRRLPGNELDEYCHLPGAIMSTIAISIAWGHPPGFRLPPNHGQRAVPRAVLHR